MTGRACGKVILLGEHAVVYGVPALAVGIDRGVEATAERLTDDGASVLCLEGSGEVLVTDDSDLARAFHEVLSASDVSAPMRVTVHAELPPGAGLGCSAAIGVAIGRALGEALGQPASLEQSVARAMAWERVFHGNPSGVDAAVSAQGGCIRFVRGEPPQPLRLATKLELAIGHTGQSSSTKTMVEGVARLRARRPAVFQKSLDGIRSLVTNAQLALDAGDLKGLGQLMDLNQMLLSGMFLSTPEIEALCASAREEGALGAKLTGAGGGGCVVALCAGNADAVVARWQREGFSGFVTIVHPAEGRT